MKTFVAIQVAICALVLNAGAPVSAQGAQVLRVERADLGGYKLYTAQAGNGLPTVVFESGVGEDTSTWQNVQPAIAKFTRAFVYDRAGLGKSEPSPKPRSIDELVLELHQVLQTARVPAPYILVGHSLGGAIVQLYAHNYPNEIAGIVFVDPEDGRLLDTLQARMSPEEWRKRKETLDRVMPAFTPTQAAELEATKVSGKAIAAALPLPRVPIVLLTGTQKDPDFPGNPLEQDIKLELQNQLLAQLPGARHVLVPQSRHYIQDDAPQLVIDAIHDVWTKANGSGDGK
ncbi:MAG TPA: alpha/beta hydrolase [Terracidiphilus sp.]|nr:alpha/beta hydrolase [Terracidiphilus sp.]